MYYNYYKVLSQIQKNSHLASRQLFDELNKFLNLRALETLEASVQHWDTLIIDLLVTKFDSNTRKKWESYEVDIKPTLEHIQKFMKRRCDFRSNFGQSINIKQQVYLKNTCFLEY